MKKLYFLICLLIGIGSVNAATITNSKYENGQITLSGTGSKQVQIVLFDKDNKPVYMATADASSGKYNITLPKIANLTDGKYIVKTADYNGENVANKEIIVANKQVTANNIENNPNTNDSIITYLVLGLVSIVGIASIVTYINKKKLLKN